MNEALDLSKYSVWDLRKKGYKVKVKHTRFVTGKPSNASQPQLNQLLYKVIPIKGELTLFDIQNLQRITFDYCALGGSTTVLVTFPNNGVKLEGKIVYGNGTFEGKTVCSKKDHFNYKVGVKTALSKLQPVPQPVVCCC